MAAPGVPPVTIAWTVFEVCPEPQVIRPALKGADKGLGPVILAANCTNCGRCVDVCGKDVFRFDLRFHNPLPELPPMPGRRPRQQVMISSSEEERPSPKHTLKTTFAILATAACWALDHPGVGTGIEAHARCRRGGADQAPTPREYLGGKPGGQRKIAPHLR